MLVLLRGCLKSINCDRTSSEPPPKSPILGDFASRNRLKSPRMGDLGGKRKALGYFSNILYRSAEGNEL